MKERSNKWMIYPAFWYMHGAGVMIFTFVVLLHDDIVVETLPSLRGRRFQTVLLI